MKRIVQAVVAAVIVVMVPTMAFANCLVEETGKIKSRVSDVGTEIVFENASEETIQIYWLNFEGEKVQYAELAPEQTHRQLTFVTHPWVAATEEAGCLGIYMPDGQTRTVKLLTEVSHVPLRDVVSDQPIDGQISAEAMCPELCGSVYSEWTGLWTNQASDGQSLCNCRGGF